jgi:hypothetical protein
MGGGGPLFLYQVLSSISTSIVLDLLSMRILKMPGLYESVPINNSKSFKSELKNKGICQSDLQNIYN